MKYVLYILQNHLKFSSSISISSLQKMVTRLCAIQVGIRRTDVFPLAFEFKMVDAATLKIIPAIK